LTTLAVAVAVSAAAAFFAWWARTLTGAGAVAAWSVAVPILYGTGWGGGAVLAAFFVSSNLISRLRSEQPLTLADQKSDRRDAWQVYANGGAAAIGGVIAIHYPTLGMWLVTSALAAAAADTWATILGGWSRVTPVLIWSGRSVPAGTSGGITLHGTAGGGAGALMVAGTGALAYGQPMLLAVGTLIGFLGMVADSTLGAVLQGRFHCAACDTASEWRIHRCGAPTTLESGIAWLNNDGVNFFATVLAGGAAWVVWYWLAPLT
jgi:uncharacterized protein (TIGR00297 family)